MPNLVRLVFHGEIVPGADPATARQNLANLLKLQAGQVDAVFSGQRVVLKNGLSDADAARYVAHLGQLGVRAHIEAAAESNAAAPSASPAPAAPPPPPSRAEPAELPEVPRAHKHHANRDVICPACGTVQPQRVLCKQCGADMAALTAAREEEKAHAAALRTAEAEIRARGGDPTGGDDGGEVPKILSFDFSGRMGRMTYLLANLLISPVTLILAMIALRDQNMVLLLGAFIIPAIINLRASVLRCHDLGWTGWLVLLSLLPYVGAVFWLILLLMPGNAGMNSYGDPPGRSPGKHVAYAAVLCAVVGAFTFRQIVTEFRKIEEAQAKAAKGLAKDEASPPRKAPSETPKVVTEAPPIDPLAPKMYDGSINTVIVYTVGDCTPCGERRQELARIGLFPREVRADLNEAASDDMIAKLVKAGHPVSSLQMPVIDVNGTIMNNPSVAQVEKHLR